MPKTIRQLSKTNQNQRSSGTLSSPTGFLYQYLYRKESRNRLNYTLGLLCLNDKNSKRRVKKQRRYACAVLARLHGKAGSRRWPQGGGAQGGGAQLTIVGG